ncbi:MAG: HD domain-containing protein [Oscillospiraceae bacterium]
MYNEIFNFVKEYLQQHNGEFIKSNKFPFRKRSEHTWRVFKWTQRLIENGDFDDSLDKESVLIASLFHDIGYLTDQDNSMHAENSAKIFIQYAKDNNYDETKSKFIEYLIYHHSDKDIINCESTPLELAILMEADLLDETGALSIVWDCMMEGNQAEQTFIKTYNHIKNFSLEIMSSNPMRTEIGKKYWLEKQSLTFEFIRQLEFDLDI